MSIIVINRPFQKGLVNSVMDENHVLLPVLGKYQWFCALVIIKLGPCRLSAL